MGIEDLPTEQRRRDAATTYNELADALGLPLSTVDPSEPPGHWVYLVAPPGVPDVAKIGMGTADRVRRWTSHGWRLLNRWSTADAYQSRQVEQAALDALRKSGAMNSPRLTDLRRAFSTMDCVTEWFDTTVAGISIEITDVGFTVDVHSKEQS